MTGATTTRCTPTSRTTLRPARRTVLRGIASAVVAGLAVFGCGDDPDPDPASASDDEGSTAVIHTTTLVPPRSSGAIADDPAAGTSPAPAGSRTGDPVVPVSAPGTVAGEPIGSAPSTSHPVGAGPTTSPIGAGPTTTGTAGPTTTGTGGPTTTGTGGPTTTGTGGPTTTGTGGPTTTGPSPSPTTAAPPPTTVTTVPPTTAPTVGDPEVDAVAIGRFERPVDLAVRPGDPALYVVEQPGRVVRFADGETTVVADVTDRSDDSAGEQGLLGLAFSPDGERAYFNYTDRDDATVVAEYPVGAGGTIGVDAERIVITIDQPYRNHNAGDLAFGPDGYLYIPLGDGGSGGDPDRYASDPGSLLGSMLRIDTTPSASAAYSIPPDNPFAGGTFEGLAGRPEVWAWGLRNPWKIAFDPVTGGLWIADVGQNEVEEVNLVVPSGSTPAGRGADFGWSAYEGTDRFNTDVDDRPGMIPPVLTYLHGADGCSVSGGAPYRGSAITGLAPAYVYSDYCSGIVWALDLAGGRNITLMTGFGGVTAIRAGPDGELYVLEHWGTIYRIVPG